MIRRVVPLTALVALFSVGCVPVTEPVGDIDKAEPDKALVGQWTEPKDKEKKSLKIDIPPEVKGNPKGLMRATLPKDSLFPKPIWFFVSEIGKEKFINVCDSNEKDQEPDFSKEGEYAKWAKGKTRAYWIIKYRAEKDEFVLDIGDKKAFPMIAEEAKLKKNGEFFETPKDWLTNYITKNGSAKIFPASEELKLTRVKE